ncbi:ADP-forming succinate--CoA ligase subunit beta [candidate division KSB1 bacterium]|nr:ADP-forming succinate--CoA ligase subunit beta [candidate division KSB1 bacterium]
MKIHEYQAKHLLSNLGVPVEAGKVAFTPEQVYTIAKDLISDKYVLKAQVHAGGRGKAGGVRFASSPEEAETISREMFGMKLVTPQTGKEGKVVRRILVTEAVNIAKEFYAGIILDRSSSQLIFMVSTEGGVEIEKVAETHPEKILRERIDRVIGLQPFQARRLAFGLGLEGTEIRTAVNFFLALFKAYTTYDCTLLEVNPMIMTREGQLLALDLKINLDDNALFRHADLLKLRDFDEEDPLEVEASKNMLNYIKLDGSVGCMVNGAGLAMATMDIIKLAGANPANFLDVGGGASAETVESGLKIILSDKNVKAVLINIFGGIVRCDRVARGVIEAARNIGVDIPVVIRLAGTNAEEAADMLQNSELTFSVAKDLKDAAKKVVAAVA